MSIKCPYSGIQVGSVLPKGTIYMYRLGQASDPNFIYAVATAFSAPFFGPKKKKKKKKLYLQYIKIKSVLHKKDLGSDK